MERKTTPVALIFLNFERDPARPIAYFFVAINTKFGGVSCEGPGDSKRVEEPAKAVQIISR